MWSWEYGRRWRSESIFVIAIKPFHQNSSVYCRLGVCIRGSSGFRVCLLCVCVFMCVCVRAFWPLFLLKSSHTSVEEGSSETSGMFFIVQCGFGRTLFFSHHNSSYCRRCIRWMMSRQSLKTRRMFSVSTAQVKWG